MTTTISPEQWISQRMLAVVPSRPPMIYVAHPVAAQPGSVLAECTECKRAALFDPGAGVDLRFVCHHDSPIRQITEPAAIVAFNLARALRWWRWLSSLEAAVWIMPWYVNVLANGEADKRLIDLGLRDDCEVVKRCDAVMACGARISSGMRKELNAGAGCGVVGFQVTGSAVGEPHTHVAPHSIPWRFI
jgi:hypothetical protein